MNLFSRNILIWVGIMWVCTYVKRWWLSGKASACNAGNAGDAGSILELGRAPGGGNSNPLQCSCLENPKDRGAWWATVHGVTKSLTWLSMHHNHWAIDKHLCIGLYKITPQLKSFFFNVTINKKVNFPGRKVSGQHTKWSPCQGFTVSTFSGSGKIIISSEYI